MAAWSCGNQQIIDEFDPTCCWKRVPNAAKSAWRLASAALTDARAAFSASSGVIARRSASSAAASALAAPLCNRGHAGSAITTTAAGTALRAALYTYGGLQIWTNSCEGVWMHMQSCMALSTLSVSSRANNAMLTAP